MSTERVICVEWQKLSGQRGWLLNVLLSCRPGSKLVVTDMSDPEWWRGKCNGQQGYFPASCAMRIYSGEKVMKLTKSVQVGEAGKEVKIQRDQVCTQ